MSNQQRAPIVPRKKTLLNDYRQAHPSTEAPLEGGKYPAQLMWEQKNNGNIVLKINDGVYKEGAKNTHKEVEMDLYDRGVFFEAILEASVNPEFTTKQLVVKRKQFVFAGGQGRMSDTAVTQVTLTLIRDDKGCVAIGYSKGDYKAIVKFKGPRETVVLVKGPDGERTEDHGIMSRWAARNWVNFHRPVLDRMELDGWEPPKPREGANTGGGRSTGGGGGNSSSSFDNDFDEDVDF